jgi:type II secretory pathway component PulC
MTITSWIFHALLLAPSAGTPAAPPVPTVESTLTRSAFDAAIARGPQRIVASVEVRPALDRGRFLGFQIVRWLPDGDLRDCTSILAGDVIVSVNRESLERPEQFMRAWEVVKTATALEVEVLRAGQRLLYRWKIEP